jgi:hypothetical protein
MARKVASFHYIDRLEATILYSILRSTNESLITVDELFTTWPKKEHERGPYAWVMRERRDAQRLLDVLCEIRSVLR